MLISQVTLHSPTIIAPAYSGEIVSISLSSTLRNETFNILKVLDRGPLRLVKLTKTFIALNATFHKGDLSVVKVL